MTKTIALILLSASVLAGCNTIAGMGRDVSSVGHAMSKTADSTK